MSTRIIAEDGLAATFCSVSGLAFGPVWPSREEASAFLRFCRENGGDDPRSMPDDVMERKAGEFRARVTTSRAVRHHTEDAHCVLTEPGDSLFDGECVVCCEFASKEPCAGCGNRISHRAPARGVSGCSEIF